MGAQDVLQRPLDADGHPIRRLGVPQADRDATFTDRSAAPKPVGRVPSAGTSLLAAPADHQHASPTPMRVVASGSTSIAAGARVTLATWKRAPGELVPPGGFAYVADDADGVTWENEVSGADQLSTYHERTATHDELRFRAVNASKTARTLEWAAVALALPPA